VSRVVNIAGVDRHMKGWRPDKPDPRDRHLMVSEAVRLLDLVDLRPQCPPVVDQGGIGSCTANSSCSAMAFLEHKAKQDTLFSRLFLYAMTRHIEGTPLSEDSGAEIRDVMKALSTYGVPFESEWPYIESKFSTEPPAKAKTDALQHKAVFYYRCPSLYTLKASLHQGFPVVIGFAVPDNMMTSRCAQTGIVLPPAPGESFDGGHAVMAVGYDVHQMCGHEQGAVLCQNSWSTSWGIDGYFWLPMSFWSGGVGALATDCWTIRRAMV
jgi:C1A family cysteine protease